MARRILYEDKIALDILCKRNDVDADASAVVAYQGVACALYLWLVLMNELNVQLPVGL